MSHAIQGGSIRWTVDMKQVRGLNQQIEEATAQIEARNAYLAEENRIRQERAELETRNHMYDSITRILKPQFDQIDALLGGAESVPEKRIAQIAVISAYITRRGNMELLSAAGTLTVVELVSAVTESLDYMRLCGVNTAISSFGKSGVRRQAGTGGNRSPRSKRAEAAASGICARQSGSPFSK